MLEITLSFTDESLLYDHNNGESEESTYVTYSRSYGPVRNVLSLPLPPVFFKFSICISKDAVWSKTYVFFMKEKNFGSKEKILS